MTHAASDVVPRSPRAGRAGRAVARALAVATLALGLALPTSAFAASPAAGTSVATDGAGSTACPGGAWPTFVQGAPAFRAGSPAGDYLWHDATGWHLRVTHASTSRVVFSGTIRANKPIHVTAARLEAEDRFTVSADGLSVTYRFVNHGGLDGIDFTTECATRIGVAGRLNGSLLPVRRIWIGHAGRHPLQNPFVIYRRS